MTTHKDEHEHAHKDVPPKHDPAAAKAQDEAAVKDEKKPEHDPATTEIPGTTPRPNQDSAPEHKSEHKDAKP